MRTSTSAQAPVVQPVPASQQRVSVQATGSSQKGVQVQQLSRVQQVPQQVQQVQHPYPSQVQYVEGGEAVYPNGTIRTAYSYYTEGQLYGQGSTYFDSQTGGTQVTTVVSSASGASPHSMVGITMDVGGSQIISSGTSLFDVSVSFSQPTALSGLLTLIRSVFMGLRTRRLGTRGNSKYHYYGIRVKPDSPLSRLQDDSQYMAMRQQPVHQKQRFKPLQKVSMMGDGLSGGSQHSSGTPEQSVAAQSQHHQQFIDMSHALPPFPSLDLGSCPLPERITMNDVKKLQSIYRDHCEATLDVVMNLQFHLIEKLWQTFWYSTAPSSDSTTTIVPNRSGEIEGVIPSEKLIALCKFEPVKQWMRSCDHILYQALVEILIPDVLRPVPSTLTQAIRNFAKSLESWLTSAMSNFPQEIVRTKAAVVSAFAQTLRRYTSLNHLAQAARAVLQNTSQINQMLSDLNRVDFANVQEQASWVCQCDESVVQRLEQDFKVTLQQQSSLDQWAAWLDNVVSQVLKPHEGSPSFPRAARQFLLKWSFYSSMVIRDLTLRSAASFGSFHLIRLLYDEYMFYLVEHRVAQATGETPIAVMGEFSDLSSMMPPLLEKGTNTLISIVVLKSFRGV
uniref:DNA-binding protein RFX2 n=1 Tax=Pygocentrus nattereri TaxID=42514 RepID=A0AAR2IQ88_PYGNA